MMRKQAELPTPFAALNINVYNFGRKTKLTRKTLQRINMEFQSKLKKQITRIKKQAVRPLKKFRRYEFKQIERKEKLGKKWRISLTHFEMARKKGAVTRGHYNATIWFKGRRMRFRTLSRGGSLK